MLFLIGKSGKLAAPLGSKTLLKMEDIIIVMVRFY